MSRPKSDQPYATGPEPHRRKWRIRVHRRSDAGKRETRIYSFDTETEAEKFKRAFAVVRATHGQTIGEAVDKYMAWCADKGNKARTMETARWRLGNILDLDALLVELRPAKAQRLYDTLRESALSIDSQRTSLVQAKAFGKWCLKTKLLPSNPFEAVEAKGRPARGKPQMRIDEGHQLKQYCLQRLEHGVDQPALIVLLAGWRGLRASEIVGLTVRDCDDNYSLLWVADRDGKTEAARRRLRLPEWLRPAIRRHCEAVGEGALFAIGMPRRAMSRHRALDMAQALMADAGVPVISLHGLRGLFSTLTATATAADGDIKNLSREMGHTSETMTLRHYIDRDALDDAKVGKL